LPYMYALTLRCCVPLCTMRIYQAMHACLCYNYCMYLDSYSEQTIGELISLPIIHIRTYTVDHYKSRMEQNVVTMSHKKNACVSNGVAVRIFLQKLVLCNKAQGKQLF